MSLGTPNWALMNRWKGAKRPFLGPRVGKNLLGASLLLVFRQSLSEIRFRPFAGL
jgi:hypothetical protein